MKQTLVFVLMLLLAAASFSASTQAPAENPRLFLSALKDGQPVSLKEVSGRYELSVLDGVAGVQGHKIIDVASDHVIVQDIAGVTETHIPVYSIKAIVRLKVPEK